MREIKFRAWDDVDKRVVNVKKINWHNRTVVLEGDITRRFNDIKLMQYTGQMDHFDKEIYEGYIIQITDLSAEGNELIKKQTVSEVIFEESSFMYKSDATLDYFDTPLIDTNSPGIHYPLNVYKVIGNIYEHPHLLSGD